MLKDVAASRALFTRVAMMLSKLEAGPADVVDRGVHTAAPVRIVGRDSVSLSRSSLDATANGLGSASGHIGTDGFGIGIGFGLGVSV